MTPKMVSTSLVASLLITIVTSQFPPGVPNPANDIKFHAPSGHSTPPTGHAPRVPSYQPKHNMNFNLKKEREHIKEQVKEEYMDLANMDDDKLLMQYFRKHDTDNNHKLDGLELLKAIARMEEDDHHHDDDDDDGNVPEKPKETEASGPKFSIDQIIPIVDSILEQDDKDKDGYINWPEFVSRQKQHQNK